MLIPFVNQALSVSRVEIIPVEPETERELRNAQRRGIGNRDGLGAVELQAGPKSPQRFSQRAGRPGANGRIVTADRIRKRRRPHRLIQRQPEDGARQRRRRLSRLQVQPAAVGRLVGKDGRGRQRQAPTVEEKPAARHRRSIAFQPGLAEDRRGGEHIGAPAPPGVPVDQMQPADGGADRAGDVKRPPAPQRI